MLEFSDKNLITITAAVIVKNEERCIERCFNSLKQKFDEIIFIDTGSTDNTLNLINAFADDKVKLFHEKWDDDFSKPRNLAISKASCDYIFFVDADETVISEKNDIYRSFFDLDKSNDKKNIALSPLIKNHCGNCSNSVRRGFHNNGLFRFYGFIHEELRRIDKKPIIDVSSKIIITHDGYKDEIINEKNKTERNCKLNKKNLTLEPNHLRWNYFFHRDGFENSSPDEIFNNLVDKIKIDISVALNADNIKNDIYTFPILDLMVRAKLKSMNSDDDFYMSTKLMNYLIPNNSNSFYYKIIYDLFKWKLTVKKTVNEIVKFKENGFQLDNKDMIHSEGLHIDSALALYLYECGHISQSYKLFLSIKECGFTTELMNNYLSLLSTNLQKVIL